MKLQSALSMPHAFISQKINEWSDCKENNHIINRVVNVAVLALLHIAKIFTAPLMLIGELIAPADQRDGLSQSLVRVSSQCVTLDESKEVSREVLFRAGDQVNSGEVSGDEVTDDEVTDDEVTDDEVTDDEVSGVVTGDEVTDDEVSSDESEDDLEAFEVAFKGLKEGPAYGADNNAVTIAESHERETRYSNNKPYDFNVYQHPTDKDFYYNATCGFLKINFQDQSISMPFTAAQGPMVFRDVKSKNIKVRDTTVPDFWNMVYSGSDERHYDCIVCLGSSNENGKKKFCGYVPEDLNQAMRYGDFFVTKTQSATLKDTDIKHRIFSITSNQNSSADDSKAVTVEQYQFEKWMDHENFSVEDLLVALDEIPEDKKVLVHCSAGLGRTGTFIAARAIKIAIEKGIFYPDLVKDIIENLRSQRRGSVQTVTQYQMLCQLASLLQKRRQGDLQS